MLRNHSVTSQGILCLEILFSGRFTEEVGCMTELQINCTVFNVSGVLPLFPGASLFGWVTEAYTALCHCCTQHMGNRCWQAVCQDAIGTPCAVSTDVAPFQFEKHTCGRDHLLLTSSPFLQLAAGGINALFWILSRAWEGKAIGTLQIPLCQWPGVNNGHASRALSSTIGNACMLTCSK